jgi:hypothetical protein
VTTNRFSHRANDTWVRTLPGSDRRFHILALETTEVEFKVELCDIDLCLLNAGTVREAMTAMGLHVCEYLDVRAEACRRYGAKRVLFEKFGKDAPALIRAGKQHSYKLTRTR